MRRLSGTTDQRSWRSEWWQIDFASPVTKCGRECKSSLGVFMMLTRLLFVMGCHYWVSLALAFSAKTRSYSSSFCPTAARERLKNWVCERMCEWEGERGRRKKNRGRKGGSRELEWRARKERDMARFVCLKWCSVQKLYTPFFACQHLSTSKSSSSKFTATTKSPSNPSVTQEVWVDFSIISQEGQSRSAIGNSQQTIENADLRQCITLTY